MTDAVDMPEPESRPHWLTRKRLQQGSWALLVFFVLFVSLFAKVMLLAPDARNTQKARDFVTFYAASSLVRQGTPEAVYDLDSMRAAEKAAWPNTSAFPWFYPPTYLAVVAPLSTLDYLPAYALLMLISLTCFCAAARRWHPDPAAWLPILAFPAIVTNIMFGQNGLLTAALALMALYYLDRRPLLSGFWIGLLAIKPHLGLLFPLALLLGRHWRVFASAALTTLAFSLLTLLLFGVDTWKAFLGSTADARHALETGIAVWNVMITPFSNVRLLGGDIMLAYGLQAAFALLYLTVLIGVWRGCTDIWLRGSILALATLNFSPYQFDYEMSWMAIPVALLAARGLQMGWLRGERELLILAWFFPVIETAVSMSVGVGQQELTLVAIPQLILLWLIVKKWRALTQTHTKARQMRSDAPLVTNGKQVATKSHSS